PAGRGCEPPRPAGRSVARRRDADGGSPASGRGRQEGGDRAGAPEGPRLLPVRRRHALRARGGNLAAERRLAREVVEERAEQAVRALRTRDPHSLAGCVRADDLGPDRDHLDTIELLSEYGTLDTAMDDGQVRLGPEDPRERRGGSPEESRVEPRLPRRVRAADVDRCTALARELVHPLEQ